MNAPEINSPVLSPPVVNSRLDRARKLTDRSLVRRVKELTEYGHRLCAELLAPVCGFAGAEGRSGCTQALL